MRRAAALAVLTLSLALPAGASAHALLEKSEPARGANPATSPEEVALFFNEPVEASFGAVRIFDSAGEEVETGPIARPAASSEAISVALPKELGDDGYTVTYRVVSADSHPVSGGYVFSVGEGGTTPGATVSELLDGSDSGSVTSVAFWAARWIGYVAIGLGIGLLAFLLLVRPRLECEGRGAFERRARSLMLAVALAGVLSSLAALVLQGATAAGTSFFDALDPEVLGDVLGTRYGTLAAVRAATWIAFAALIATRLPRLAAAVPLAVILATPALAGHAATQDPSWLLVPANLTHVLAMSLWFGGLAAFPAVVPAATRRLEPAERSSVLASALTRFSPLALACVIALIASGTLQSLVYLGPLTDLLDTAFGRAVLIKIVLLAILVGIGVLHRRRLLPALNRIAERRESPGAAGVTLRRALRAEVALIFAVLGVTAALVSYQPPADAAQGPVSGTTEVGDAVLDYTVEPAQPGSNEMHLYLFDAEDGSQLTAAREVTAHVEQPEEGIGPIEAELERSGPGHYVAPSAPFGVPGEWTVEVAVRTTRFSENRANFEVPIK